MRQIWSSLRATLLICMAVLAFAPAAYAQKRIALKGGESVDLRNFFYITACRSVLIGKPEVEVLEGPEEIVVTVREEPVLPRSQNCPNTVPGGIIVATAKEVTEPKEGRLTFRLKFNTKLGPRQDSNTYIVSLFPGTASAGSLGGSTPSGSGAPN